jgi:hypothetical protein
VTLRYRSNQDLRREIVAAVGVSDLQRYGADQCGLCKADLYAVARALGDPPDDEMTVSELYHWLCGQVGLEYGGNAGRDWRLRREQLKAIHRAVADGGGSDA